MTTVPPPNVALPQVLAAAAAPTTIVIPQPPPALAAVPVGTVIEAVVLPTPPAASPITASVPGPVLVLQTALGDLAVRLPAPLPANVPVDLEVVRSTPQQVTVRLTTIDGAPAQQYLAQARAPVVTPTAPVVPGMAQPGRMPVPAGPQPLPPGMTWMPSGPAPFVQSGTISAVVTQAPPPIEAPVLPAAAPPPPTPNATPTQAPAPTPAAPSPFAALQLGTQSELALKIVSVQLPGAPVVAAPSAAPTITPQVMTTAPSTPVAVTPPTTPVATPTIVLAGAQSPPAPPLPPTLVQSPPPLATVTGVVIANTDGIPTVEIEDRQVQLNVRANLPVGSKIVFDVTATALPRTNAPLPLPLPAAALPLSGPAGAHTGWPTLSEAVNVLQRSDPVAAQQLAQAVPDGGPRTVAAVIAFTQAMRSGDARQWPGDPSLRALERASPRGAQLAATLSGEVAELASRARDTGAEWRAVPVPWNAGGQIDRIALITRREGDDDGSGAGGRKGGGTRFLLDLDLSRLGPMQLDGMFKADVRAFDLVLRTKAALPEAMRRDLTGIFTDANGAMGLKGGITFQVTKKFAAPLGGTNTPDKSGLWA